MNRAREPSPSMPTWEILEKAHELFLEEEPRDAMYKISTRLIEHYWNEIPEISNALGVLLLTWNSSLYRFGMFSYDEIEGAIRKHKPELDALRNRQIVTLRDEDTDKLREIYNDLLVSLRSVGKKGSVNQGKEAYSPVSVGKALHLLCPSFFPLWDNAISNGYGCRWKDSLTSFDFYLKFMHLTIKQVDALQNSGTPPSRLLNVGSLKLLDEYNYMRYTKGKGSLLTV